ncbi:o-succinylbenzoate synthase [Chlorobium sp. N1]|uniref:o-succinylbenzoate synthase n=1 Tax=Chlorobium sp. N1 TaxID=2491138 RepID=UPI00103DEF0C|nr:o-succinylbenzoate synthase [Chlorobium sp. N1]TCD47902.1 o-succinylbenzoate synthase [Chlorobium sp. N1]
MSASYAYLYRYTLPFTEPVSVRGRRLLNREGLLLALKSEDGAHGAWGEIAPLPGLHRETLEGAERQILETLSRHGENGSSLCTEGLFPSVRMGLEMAVMNLEASITGRRPFGLDARSPLPAVPLNALLAGPTESVLAHAEASFRAGYRAFKLKVRLEERGRALDSVRELHRMFEGRARLRLDANQAFTLEEAVRFARELPEGSVSYIEEPLREPRNIAEFHNRTGLSSALDETLWQKPGLFESLPEKAVGALVLKPNCLGGLAAVLRLVSHAAEHGMEVVFSSAYESGVSLGFYTLLAAATSPRPAACGLDTFRSLKVDLSRNPPRSEGGVLKPEAIYRESCRVETRRLSLASIWTL